MTPMRSSYQHVFTLEFYGSVLGTEVPFQINAQYEECVSSCRLPILDVTALTCDSRQTNGKFIPYLGLDVGVLSTFIHSNKVATKRLS